MRRIWHCLPHSIIFCLLLNASGCATLPKAMPVPEEEGGRIRDSFLAAMASQQRCGQGVDADVTVSYNSLLQSGAAAGYFQAEAPSSIKFIAENPFGQPLLALYSNGQRFVLLSLPARMAYAGAVAGETFRKYAPAGFRPDEGFYWLTGRLGGSFPAVSTVGRQQDGPGYWLRISATDGETSSQVLYDPQQGVIRRRLQLDEDDKPVFDVTYDAYGSPLVPNGGSDCLLPGLVSVSSGAQRARLEIHFRNWAVSDDFPDRDFEPVFPDDFQIVQVQ